MARPANINDAIENAATAPKRAKDGNQEVEQHDLDQLLKADNHQKAKTAGGKTHFGLRFARIEPPGTG